MNINKVKSYLNVFWHMLKTDLIIVKHNILGSILNSIILVTALVVIFSYVFPAFMGASQYFGPFALIGMLVNIPLFTMFPFVAQFVADIEGNNSTSYYLILPIPSWLIFIKNAVSHAIKTIIMSSIILPLGKLILWNRLDFSNLSIFKFVLMVLILNLFFSMFAVFLFTIPKDMEAIENVWIRIIFPLWFFGCAEFSWQTIYNINKRLAFLDLLNPFVYTFEGIRSAFFGQAGFILFGVCSVMTILFSLFFAWAGIKRLKKRLDFI